MTLEELARHIGMDVREVAKLADKGKLPGHKVSGQWRVNRAQVTEWLQQEAHTLTQAQLESLDRAMGDGDDQSIVGARLGAEGIDMHLHARSKPSVLRELIGLAERTGLVWDKDGLLAALQEREGLCSTGLPNGIAIPHPRQPMPYATGEPLVCIGRVQAGVVFDAPGGVLTDLFFLLLSHDDRQHLQVLARLMRMLDETTLAALRETEDEEEVLQLILDREQAVITQQGKKGKLS